MNEEISNGFLIVKVSTAGGAIPVEGVTVVVRGNEDEHANILLSLLTDRDGLTKKVSLPAPARALSGAPSPASKPYSTYNIDVFKEGYYPQHYNRVPVFDGIVAVQSAAIIPISEFDAQNPYYSDGQIFEEYENENL